MLEVQQRPLVSSAKVLCLYFTHKLMRTWMLLQDDDKILEQLIGSYVRASDVQRVPRRPPYQVYGTWPQEQK